MTPAAAKRFKYTRLPFSAPALTNNLLPSSSSQSSLVLRDYQQDAVDACQIALAETPPRAILAAPCGSGKSEMSAHIALSYDTVITLSPLKAHAEQTLNRFRQILHEHTAKLVDSDGTRDAEELKLLVTSNQKSLLSATYRSTDVDLEQLQSLERSADSLHY